MNELRRIIGKTIESVVSKFDGENAYVIIKFKEGGKINITAFVSGEEDGSGQLNAEYHGRDIDLDKKSDDLIGLKIRVIEEDYDGANAYLRIKFEGGSELLLTSYSSDDTSTANISVDVYESEKNNQYDMKDIIMLVEEDFALYEKRGRKPKLRNRGIESGDAWGDDMDDDGEIDPRKHQIEAPPEDEVGNPNLEVAKALDHELKAPEFSRAYIKFKLLGTGEKLKAIPMARMSGGTAYLFKTMKGDLRKVKLSDMILENVNESDINEGVHPFTEYVFEIADIIKIEVPDWEAILEGLDIEYVDLVSWLEEGKDFDLLAMFDQGLPAEEAAAEVIMWLESVGYEEDENEFDEE